MMKAKVFTLSKYFLALFASLALLSSCTDEDPDDDNNTSQLPAECVSIFTDLEGTASLTAGAITGGPGTSFTSGSIYEVNFTAAGKTTIHSDANDFVFEADDITNCEENANEVNVFYDNGTYDLIVQVEGQTIQLILSDANGQVSLTYTPGPDVSLITPHAGTHTVTTVNNGTHTRMTVIIGTDGSIDFDAGVAFAPGDYELISDRLDCCDAVYIDCTPYPSEPYPRLELNVVSGTLIGITYRPNYPNIGSVEVVF